MKLTSFVFLLAFAACRSEAPSAPDVTPAPAETAPTPSPAPPDASAPAADVSAPTPDAGAPADAAATPTDTATAAKASHEPKLLEAGAEPRAVLTYGAAQGFSQTLGLTMGLTLKMEVDGQPVVSDLPRTRMTLGAKVVERTAGSLVLALEVSQAQVEGTPSPGAATRLAEVIADLAHLSGKKSIDEGGRHLSLEIARKADVPAAVAPVLEGFEQALDQMLVPLPREAIGVGARWEVRHTVTQAGVELAQVTTYELTRLDGRKLTLKLGVALDANGLTGAAGGAKAALPGGLAARLDKVEGRGEGTLTVDLDALYPSPLEAKNAIALELTLDGSSPTPRKMKVDMGLELSTSP